MRWLGLIAVVGALMAAAPAHAATYTVYGCKKPDGTPAPADGWRAGGVQNAPAATTAECAAGGPMRVQLAPNAQHNHNDYADLVFESGGPAIVGYTVYRELVVRGPAGADANPRYHADLLENGGGTDVYCRGACGPFGSPATPLGEASAMTRGPTRLGSLIFRVSCFTTATTGGENPQPVLCPATEAPPSQWLIHRAQVVLEDMTDPEFSSPPSGTLFDTGRELSGTVSASFSVRDTGSGVYRAIVDVDGRPVTSAVVDENNGRCTMPFTYRLPCKPSAAGTISLDTASLEDGDHNVTLRVQDATQSNEIAYGPVRIRTKNRNPGRGGANGLNAADGARLLVGWQGRKGRELRSRFGRRVTLAGTLKDSIGRPIIGGAVEIWGRELRAGADERLLARAITKADGAWAYRFAARPGMSIAVRYRAFANDPGFAAEARATLRVRAAATLRVPRVVRRGRRLVARGRLRGGPIPRGGKSVVLQVFDGGSWRDVDETKSNRTGRFTAKATIKRAGGRRTFRLRILIRRDAAYPYSLGTSPVRRVLVKP